MRAKNRADDYILDDSSEDEVDYQDEDRCPTDKDGEFELGDNGDLSSPFAQHAFVRTVGTQPRGCGNPHDHHVR